MQEQQHGDVNIWKITSLPDGATKSNNMVVRDGEATGHAHRISGSGIKRYDIGNRVFAVVEGDNVTLTHEEHGTQTLEPGTYEFGPTYEHNYDAQEAREVAD